MLNDSQVTANVPVSDLERARGFYADTLGLTIASGMSAASLTRCVT